MQSVNVLWQFTHVHGHEHTHMHTVENLFNLSQWNFNILICHCFWYSKVLLLRTSLGARVLRPCLHKYNIKDLVLYNKLKICFSNQIKKKTFWKWIPWCDCIALVKMLLAFSVPSRLALGCWMTHYTLSDFAFPSVIREFKKNCSTNATLRTVCIPSSQGTTMRLKWHCSLVINTYLSYSTEYQNFDIAMLVI